MNFTPSDYQLSISQHIQTNERCLVFAGMGLGKTASTLHAFDQLVKVGKVKRMLIVAPLRVATLTWPNEIRKWDEFKHYSTVVLRKPASWEKLIDPTVQVFTINYEQLPKLAEVIKNNPMIPAFDMVVYDETTRAKNHKSTRIKAWRKVTDHFNFRRIGLTGTPVPNSYLELWGQVALIDQGKRLCRTWFDYRRFYFYATDYMEYNWELRPGMKEIIQNKISDITLTLRSEDYLQVASTILNDVEITLPDTARKLYKEFEKTLLATINKDEQIVAANRAVLAGKLLQVTSGQVYNEVNEPQLIHRAKLEALLEIRKATKEPLLVFCAYKHEYEFIKSALPDAVIFNDEPDAVEKWNKREINTMICHPASAGHGLNLQDGGRQIVWYTLPWSRELYDQSNARLARRGQTEQPIVHRLIMLDTIDEAIVETLRERGETQNALLLVLKNLQELRKNT